MWGCSKVKYCLLMIAGFLYILLNGCDIIFRGKPDAVIEVDLSQPGKPLNHDIYAISFKDIKDGSVAKGKPGTGNLNAALHEAVYMIGLERDAGALNRSDTVNFNERKLNQDKTISNNAHSFKSPTYYVVKMFSESRPDKVMPTKVTLRSTVTAVSEVTADKQNTQKQSSTLNEQLKPSVIATSGIQEKQGLVVIKIVNAFNTSENCKIILNYRQQIKYRGEVIVMTSKNIMDENSFKEPEKVVPMTKELNGLKNTFNYKCPANSISIIYVRYKKGINGMGNCC